MTDVKRVLMISFFFAPSPAVGATRATKFYEHLPDYGWEPHILTVCPTIDRPVNELARVLRTNYWSLWKRLEQRRAPTTQLDRNLRSSTTTLYRAALKSKQRQKIYFLLRHILPMSSVRMPDATLGWYPFAVKAGLALLGARKFDVIWSSAGPPTNHLIAAHLHARTGVPWVADFRDLWSLNYQDVRVRPFEIAEAWLEHRTLSGAARIVTISEGLARILADFYGREIQVVYNGYDDISPPVAQTFDAGFTIRYTGSLYPGKQDIRPFLQALACARAVEPTFCPRVQFIGSELGWLSALAQGYGLSHIVECLDPLPREQALELQCQSTVLLLLGWSRSDGQPGVLPVKMFEYMRTGRPILEVGPKHSESAEMIARCQAGLTVEEVEDIRAVLLAWWGEFRRAGALTWSSNWEQISRYSRRAQTAQLAEIFDKL